MIEVNGLRKTFGATVALDDVTFSVGAGEIVGLLGPNGAGKTTMMRVLTGYLPPSAGSARVAGFDVQAQSIEVRKRIGYLPETVPLYGEMTVSSYLKFVADLHEIPRPELGAALERVMAQTGILDVSHRVIGHLSRGYRQRVGLAQSLLHQPEILILDEPTVGLDPKQVVEIRQLIKELASRHTVILSSHILPEVSQICSRVIIINRGRIAAIDTQEELEKRLQVSERLFVVISGPKEEVRQALAGLPGVTEVRPEPETEGGSAFAIECEHGAGVREAISRAAAQRQWHILEMRGISMSLEDMFLRLTGSEGA